MLVKTVQPFQLVLGKGYIQLGFPVFANFYGVYFVGSNYGAFSTGTLLGVIGIAAVTLASSLSFFCVLRIYVCSSCVNFSCPMNTVPKKVVDEYLKRNRVMLEAWEKTGYRL